MCYFSPPFPYRKEFCTIFASLHSFFPDFCCAIMSFFLVLSFLESSCWLSPQFLSLSLHLWDTLCSLCFPSSCVCWADCSCSYWCVCLPPIYVGAIYPDAEHAHPSHAHFLVYWIHYLVLFQHVQLAVPANNLFILFFHSGTLSLSFSLIIAFLVIFSSSSTI